jgi:hypothetical protein
VKKGRHRRFEEARKLKQQGPGAFFPGERSRGDLDADDDGDELSRLAEKYGAFDDEDDEDE